jgi:hypothetical protein
LTDQGEVAAPLPLLSKSTLGIVVQRIRGSHRSRPPPLSALNKNGEMWTMEEKQGEESQTVQEKEFYPATTGKTGICTGYQTSTKHPVQMW